PPGSPDRSGHARRNVLLLARCHPMENITSKKRHGKNQGECMRLKQQRRQSAPTPKPRRPAKYAAVKAPCPPLPWRVVTIGLVLVPNLENHSSKLLVQAAQG